MDEAIGRHGCLFSQQTWTEATGSVLSRDSLKLLVIIFLQTIMYERRREREQKKV